MKTLPRYTSPLLAVLLIVILAIGLSIQAFAQAGQDPWLSSAEVQAEGTWLGPLDNLTINPALPEPDIARPGVETSGMASSANLTAGESALDTSPPDQLHVNPDLPETAPAGKALPSAGPKSADQ